MIQSQIALLRRELWEHRAIFVVPIVVAALTTLTSLTGSISINDIEHIDMGIIGAANMPENARGAALSAILIGLSASLIFAMFHLSQA